MPFGNTSSGEHNDGLHNGSAKRDALGGVAGLDNQGNLLALHDTVYIPRGLIDKVFITERTSSELLMQFERLGIQDYEASMQVATVLETILNTAHANVAGYYAGLDAYGHVSGLVHPPIEAVTDLSMGVTHLFTQSQTSGNGAYTDYTAGGYWQVSSGSGVIGYCTLEYLRSLQVEDFHTVVTMELTTHNAGSSGNHIGYFGLKEDFTAQNNLQCAMVKQLQDDTVSFETGDASATTSTAVTSLDSGDSVAILIESGRAICYINGIVEAVHTTNLPTSTALKAGIAAHADGSSISPRIYGVAGFNVSRSG